MKDKTIAAILAFFGGIVGLHRFYVGQKGLGMAQLFFFVLAITAGASSFTVLLLSLATIFGVIDAISFLSMDEREFDLKYNQQVMATSNSNTQARTMTDRERRFQERQRQRAEREKQREHQDKARFQQRDDGPKRETSHATGNGDPGRPDRERGVRYFKDYDYREAIEAFQEALAKNSRDVAAHFNIACSYSVEEEADRALYHLDRAVALGFDDFERIRSHDSLAYLRVQPPFRNFAANNFRLVATSPDPVDNGDDPLVNNDERPLNVTAPVHDELLEQLQRLAALREKGLLTEVEFATQKRRLLG